eukprot:TRINITY_DN31632_c0_g1_i2.p1 TRINITY_DN31632_c0_g1~~TRINITY_DN31632_c0_g1_i2.p1  ORF type:complete len:224 (+),score=36.70 TRINITY_DN31632_c0_g1_i2:75-674(+)
MDPELELPGLLPSQVDLEELYAWSDLDIDFVIAGVQTCGTASLWQNLERHPQIAFTHNLSEDTDYFFTNQVARHLLPSKSIVQKFNTWGLDRQKPAIVGLRHVKIMQYPIARFVVSQIPKLTPLVMLCDPIGRAEKLYLIYCEKEQHCTGKFGKATSAYCRPGHADEKVPLDDCKRSIVGFFGTPGVPDWNPMFKGSGG